MMLLALLVALLLGVGCTPASPEQEVEFRAPVFVREVETGVVEDRIVATGSLRAAEGVALAAETGGHLLMARDQSGRRLAEGDRVDAGQHIASITGEEVKLAAGTEASRQRYEVAQREYQDAKTLFEQGLISQNELRPLETELINARIEWERSQFTESTSQLVTPIAGVILRLARDEASLPMADGQLVQQGLVVAQIAPTDTLIADVDIIGTDVARVEVGLASRVRHHAWEEHGFEGRVTRLAPSLDPMTRTLRAEVQVANPDGRLRPGMFVEVTMVVERREDVPVVPRESLTERGGRRVVFVVDGQKVNRREVVLGLGDDEMVEIKEGVDLGERIVVRGLETLTDGARVRVTGS